MPFSHCARRHETFRTCRTNRRARGRARRHRDPRRSGTRRSERRPGDVSRQSALHATRQHTRASAIYLSEDAQTERQIAILRVKDPYLAYTRALRIFHPEPELQPYIHPSAVIDPSARIAERVAIGACAVIGRNVEIAEGVCIHPNVRSTTTSRSAKAQSFTPA